MKVHCFKWNPQDRKYSISEDLNYAVGILLEEFRMVKKAYQQENGYLQYALLDNDLNTVDSFTSNQNEAFY